MPLNKYLNNKYFYVVRCIELVWSKVGRYRYVRSTKFAHIGKFKKLFLMMILTSGHHFQASGCPLFSKDPPKEMEDRGSLDGAKTA